MKHLSSHVSAICALCCSLGACGDAAEEGGHSRPPPQVEVAEARDGALTIRRRYLGTARAMARAELAAGATGAVVEVMVREGDRVERGQTLLRIDPRLARASLLAARATQQAAETSRDQATRDAERFAQAGTQAVSALEIERAESQATALEAEDRSSGAEVTRARAELARHVLIAPFDGVVAARRVDPGDWVSVGTPALELVAEGDVEILVRVEPDLLGDIDVGHEAVLVRGLARAPAHVAGVVRVLDPATRTAQLRLVPSEPPPWLLAGSAVDVVFEFAHEGEGVVVPRDALVEGIGRTRVVVLDGDEVMPIEVEVLERGNSEARVRALEGTLSVGAVVVTRGNDRLRPNQTVVVVEAAGDS